MSLVSVFALIFAFLIKQLLCDFIQPGWMATQKSKPLEAEGGRALFTHAAIHAMGTLIIVGLFNVGYWWLALIDFVVHAVIDRAKSLYVSKRKLGINQIRYWFVYGLDQTLHHATHLIFVMIMIGIL
tara:strand:+ start:811 stop:1191 length:381 start_codon:yes stop_codon:yes gene_type:complete